MKCLVIALFSIFISCSDWDTRLVLINKTEKNTRRHYEIMNLNDSIPNLFYCEKIDLYNVLSNSEQVLRTQNKWNLYLKDKPDKVLRIFIINEDSLLKYGTCKIFKQQIFMKRFDLTYNDLENSNWKVIFDEKN